MALLAPMGKIVPRPPFDPSVDAFCTKCKKVKARREFPKNPSNRSGVHSWCTVCNNAGITAWEDAHYRERRDAQAMYNRRVKGSTNTAPVKAKNVARFQPIVKQEQDSA